MPVQPSLVNRVDQFMAGWGFFAWLEELLIGSEAEKKPSFHYHPREFHNR